MASSWVQEISELLQEAQSIAVRFDTAQELTDEQQATARNNIDTKTTATQVQDNDFKIIFNY